MNPSKKTLLYTAALAVLFCVNIKAQTGQGFASVQAVSTNNAYKELPVINLNGGDKINVSFDDLEDRDITLRYRVIHLNTDGTPSMLREIEYLNGINQTDITDAEYSFNTRTNYVHYRFSFPEKGRNVKVSGSYMFEIFESGKPGTVLLRIPFMVCEANADAQIKIKTPARTGYAQTHQELEVTVSAPAALRLTQEDRCLQVYAQQNLNTSTLRRLPLGYSTGNEYHYKNLPENVFEGLNEFRNLDIRPVRHAGRGVEFTEINRGVWHAQTEKQKNREYLPYLSDDDINGNFAIRADQAQNSDIEAEYVWVHFILNQPEKFGQEIYVTGKFNDWQCNENSRMTYRENLRSYTLSLLLKQGFYDYMFAAKQRGEISRTATEGSHFETENDYYVYVFYRAPGALYDRLLCVKRRNSKD